MIGLRFGAGSAVPHYGGACCEVGAFGTGDSGSKSDQLDGTTFKFAYNKQISKNLSLQLKYIYQDRKGDVACSIAYPKTRLSTSVFSSHYTLHQSLCQPLPRLNCPLYLLPNLFDQPLLFVRRISTINCFNNSVVICNVLTG